jgi:pimeloyl-ACP methyl ester carboxylesterase
MKSLPNKLKANINGQTLEYITSGTGNPPIVLVNGSGGPVEGWYKVYAELETLATVFAYNRPGLSASSKPTQAQTGEVIVASLRALLLHAGLQPPYILVGHSLGGLYVNLFARLFPAEVAGVVFLEATSPRDVEEIPAENSPLQRLAEKMLNLVFGKDKYGETMHVKQTVTLIDQAGPFPDIPLMVVSGGRPSGLMSKTVRAIRERNQIGLSTLSPRGKRVIAAQSGHFPQFTEPGVVIQAIGEVFETARSMAE